MDLKARGKLLHSCHVSVLERYMHALYVLLLKRKWIKNGFTFWVTGMRGSTNTSFTCCVTSLLLFLLHNHRVFNVAWITKHLKIDLGFFLLTSGISGVSNQSEKMVSSVMPRLKEKSDTFSNCWRRSRTLALLSCALKSWKSFKLKAILTRSLHAMCVTTWVEKSSEFKICLSFNSWVWHLKWIDHMPQDVELECQRKEWLNCNKTQIIILFKWINSLIFSLNKNG